MPSARELLEQADALMRRNRSRETMSPAMGPRTMTPTISGRKPLAAPGDFPVLTEALETPAQFPQPSAASQPSAAPRVYPAPQDYASTRDLPASQGARATQDFIASPSPARTPPESASPREPLIDMRLRVQSPPVQGAMLQVPAQSAPAWPGPAAEVPMQSAPARHSADTALQEGMHSAANLASTLMPGLDVPPSAPPRADAGIDAPRPFARAYNDVPVLTDAIADIDAALLAEAADGDPSIWNDEAMRGDDSVLGPSPKSIAVIPEAHEIDASRLRNAAAAAADAETNRAVAASTAELIDEVRMQVLQRIDMFTDTGLRDQLGERLKPIVDRASAELVATINQHVGELLRTYVAEAIERELDRLRNELR